MESLIVKAREFVEKVLSNDKSTIEKDHYYMFLVSKFLLLKEYMIKKDSKNNILYFDYKKNKKYIPAIKYIVDYIKENGEVLQNSTKIEVKNNTSGEDLDSYIWIFNKIRDSFAHGMYRIDLENEQIVIDNDHSNDRNPYVLKCALPIELLEFFTYNIENPASSYDLDYEKEYAKYISKIRNEFSYSSDYKIDVLKDYNNYINDKKSYNLYKINYFENKFIRKIGANIYNIDDLYLKDENNYSLEYYEKMFEMLMIMLKSSKDLSENEKEKLLSYLESLGFIDKISKEYTIKKKRKKDKKYLDKLVCVIEEMSSILGLKNNSKNLLVIPALYNYMQLAFSFIDSKSIDKKNLGYLKLSKLKPTYVKVLERESGDKRLTYNDESMYSLKTSAIERQCESFISGMNDKMLKYNSNQNQGFRHSLMDSFAKFYSDMILSFIDKNSFIVTSLRNSVEHANITELNGYVILNDRSNQDDSKTINFSCYSKPKDLYEIVKSIELGTTKEDFSISDFLEELKYIVSGEVYNGVLDTLQKMSNIIFGKDLELNYSIEKMYIEATAGIISQSIRQK